MLENLTVQLDACHALTALQVADAVEQLVNESVSAEQKADFLTKLALKGETVEEIAAFARALREKSVTPPLDAETRAREILDVCGTGGDHLGTFNISTTVAIVCAAAGVTVAKHGNRAITSQAGSADVLEALGVRIDLPPTEAARSIKEHNFAFFFAPNYHPAFKHIAPARKLCAERKQRTIFNFLGPLLNPARPTTQLIGVPRPDLCEPIAKVAQSLGVRRGMVVSGSVAPLRTYPPFDFEPTNRGAKVRVLGKEGTSQTLSISDALALAKQRNAVLAELSPKADPPVCVLVEASKIKRLEIDSPEKVKRLDELSTIGDNTIAEFYQEKGFSTSVIPTGQFPVQFASLADLLGGDRNANAEIVRRILDGDERGPKLDAVLLNAGAALFVAGKARSIVDGWGQAAEVIASGRASAKLLALTAR